MFNVLITGGSGQVGTEIRHLSSKFKETLNIVAVTREELDLEDRLLVENFILKHNIHGIINAAAYTAVDLAEKEEKKANRVNVFVPELLAKISKHLNLRFLHISTDFVFDGRTFLPYKEENPTSPLSVYGSSKEKGERAVLSANEYAIILRTSWVYSKFGNNFVKTIRRLGKEKSELRVISDQIGSPTWARDLADISLVLIQSKESGTFHYSNEGVASWYDFAKEILEGSNIKTKILPIETKDYPTPAARPPFSVLNKSKIKQTLGIEIPYWKDSLKLCLAEFD